MKLSMWHYECVRSESGEIIHYRNEFIQSRAKPRSICVQIKDWLKSIGMNIEFVNEHGVTVWEIGGEQALSMSLEENGICLIVIRRWLWREIVAGGMPKHLTHCWQIRNREDLRLVKPLIRLALNSTEAQRLRDMQLIRWRLTGSELPALTKLCLDGIFPYQSTLASNRHLGVDARSA